jgi:hypothetical protein
MEIICKYKNIFLDCINCPLATPNGQASTFCLKDKKIVNGVKIKIEIIEQAVK